MKRANKDKRKNPTDGLTREVLDQFAGDALLSEALRDWSLTEKGLLIGFLPKILAGLRGKAGCFHSTHLRIPSVLRGKAGSAIVAPQYDQQSEKSANAYSFTGAITWSVRCDGCTRLSTFSALIEDLAHIATHEGWYIGDGHYCPECRAERGLTAGSAIVAPSYDQPAEKSANASKADS